MLSQWLNYVLLIRSEQWFAGVMNAKKLKKWKLSGIFLHNNSCWFFDLGLVSNSDTLHLLQVGNVCSPTWTPEKLSGEAIYECFLSQVHWHTRSFYDMLWFS